MSVAWVASYLLESVFFFPVSFYTSFWVTLRLRIPEFMKKLKLKIGDKEKRFQCGNSILMDGVFSSLEGNLNNSMIFGMSLLLLWVKQSSYLAFIFFIFQVVFSLFGTCRSWEMYLYIETSSSSRVLLKNAMKRCNSKFSFQIY